MGGHALKVETVRLSRELYARESERVLGRIREYARSARVCVIDAYREKPDFGDMDILIENGASLDAREMLQKLFAPPEIIHNGGVYSFGIETELGIFQVDLITVAPEIFDVAKNYFAWNDLGNLIGRIAHKMGFKYGHDGLWFPLRSETYLFRDVLLTRDTAKILEFLGYNPTEFFKGFDTLKDVFRYAASTPYFNPRIYLLDNRNHIARKRDKKRKTYNEFLDWLEDPQNISSTSYPWPLNKERGDGGKFLDMALDFFDGFRPEYERAIRDFEKRTQYHKCFNGEMVKAVTGLKDRELGDFIKLLREKHVDFEAFILGLGVDGARKYVEDIWLRK